MDLGCLFALGGMYSMHCTITKPEGARGRESLQRLLPLEEKVIPRDSKPVLTLGRRTLNVYVFCKSSPSPPKV